MPLQVNHVVPLELCVQLVIEGNKLTLVTEKRRKKILLAYVPKNARVMRQHISREDGMVAFIEGLVVGTLHHGSLIYCETLLNPNGTTVYFQVYNDKFTGDALPNMSAALRSFCEKAKVTFKGAENGRSVFGLTRPVLQAVLQSIFVKDEAERYISHEVTSVTLALKPWLPEEADLANSLAPYAQTERLETRPSTGPKQRRKRSCPFDLQTSKQRSLCSMDTEEFERLLKGLFPVVPEQSDLIVATSASTDLQGPQDIQTMMDKLPKLEKQASVDTIYLEGLPIEELDSVLGNQDSFSSAIWGNEDDEY